MVGLVPPLDLNIYINKVAVCVFVCPEYFPLQLTQLPMS